MIEEKLYFEDLEIGRAVESPGRTLTEPDAVRYIGLTGEWEEWTPDEGGARQIPNLLTLCASGGLGWRVPQPPLAILAFMGLEWQFLQPLRIGDTVRNRSWTLAKRAVKDGGVVVEQREVLNQRGEVVQSGRLTLLVARRPES